MFENPLTSRAWLEQEVQQLMDLEEVILVATDQCRFDLRSIDGGLHKKPTGFLTNSPNIAEQLSKRCDGSHEHGVILGNNKGGNRARQAQAYPRLLVDAILRGYRQQLNETTEVHLTTAEEIYQEWSHQNERQRITDDQVWKAIGEIYATDGEKTLTEDKITQNVAVSADDGICTE